MKMGMGKKEGKRGRERKRATMLEVEEKLSNGGGVREGVPKGWRRKRAQEEGWRVKKRMRRYKRKDYSKASRRRSKVGEIKQVVFFLCCQQGIEIWERRKTSDRMSKGMTASLDLVQVSDTYVV